MSSPLGPAWFMLFKRRVGPVINSGGIGYQRIRIDEEDLKKKDNQIAIALSLLLERRY